MNRRLSPLTRWRESLYWIRRLRQFLYGDYDHLKSFAALLEERSDIKQHLALPIAFATLERVSRSDGDDIYAIDGAITSVLSDLDDGRLTLRDGATPVSAPPDAASRVQVITLRRYDFRWFQRFEIDLLQARTLREGENQLTGGHGLSARPAARLDDSYPDGQGVMDGHDLAELNRRLMKTLDDPVFVDVGHSLTAFELDIGILIVRELILHPERHDFTSRNMKRVLDHLWDEWSRRRSDWGVKAPNLFV